MATRFPPFIVSTFGGGLNLEGHPAQIRDDQWTWCQGFVPLGGAAVQLPAMVNLATPIGGAGDDILGFSQDAFSDDHVIVGVHATGNVFELYKVSVVGGVVQITRTGGTADPLSEMRDTLSSAFLNGFQVFCGGMQNANSVRSTLARYSGTATYDTIDPPAGEELRPQQLVSFGSHLIGGGIFRTAGGLDYDDETKKVAWSSANNESLWLPALSNDADDVFLDDVTGPIIGIVPIGSQLVAIFTRDQTHMLQPTQRIPAFRRDVLSAALGAGFPTDVGNTDRMRIGLFGQTPFGACIVGSDNVYLLSPSITPIATPIRSYFFGDITTGILDVNDVPRPIVWHPRWQQILIGRPVSASFDRIVLTYNPVEQAWGRLDLKDYTGQTSDANRMGIVRFENRQHRFLTYVSRQVMVEDTSAATGYTGAVVDTKDFSAADQQLHLSRLVVDLETRNAVTVTVSIWSRDQLNPTAITSDLDYYSRIITPSYTTVGTISAASPELPLRARGKYHRFRFQATSGGRVRIRGFKIDAQPAGDR